MNTDDPAPAEPDKGPAPDTQQPRDASGRARDGRGHFIRSIDVARRDAEAAEYLADHPGTTYQQLADRFGYSDKGNAWRAIQSAKRDAARPAVTKLIATESAELDSLYLMAMEVIEANHVVVSHGKVVTMIDPASGEEKPLTDNGPKLQAILAALKVRESYRKLHGLDAAEKVSVTGSVRYEVVGVDPADLT